MPKATTGWPLRLAKLRASAAPSLTVAISFNLVFRPPGSTMVRLASCATGAAPASVRMACSCEPTWPRPPARSTLLARNCSFTSSAVMPSAISRSGSSETRISRSTPPARVTWAAAPPPVWRRRVAVFAGDAPGALDLGDAANALQRRRNDVIDKPGHLLGGPRGNRRRIGDDRHPFDVEPLDRRLLDSLRQLRADVRHRVTDIIHRAIGRGLQMQTAAGGRPPHQQT